jgi:hypothetical protein
MVTRGATPQGGSIEEFIDRLEQEEQTEGPARRPRPHRLCRRVRALTTARGSLDTSWLTPQPAPRPPGDPVAPHRDIAAERLDHREQRDGVTRPPRRARGPSTRDRTPRAHAPRAAATGGVTFEKTRRPSRWPPLPQILRYALTENSGPARYRSYDKRHTALSGPLDAPTYDKRIRLSYQPRPRRAVELMPSPAPGPPPAAQGTRLSIRRSMGILQGTHMHLADLALTAVQGCGTEPERQGVARRRAPPAIRVADPPSRKRPGEPHLHTAPVESQDGRCRRWLMLRASSCRSTLPGHSR